MSGARTALTKARLACEQLERALRVSAQEAKEAGVAKGDSSEDEAAAWVKLESAADAVVKGLKALLDAKSWMDAATVRGWEQAD